MQMLFVITNTPQKSPFEQEFRSIFLDHGNELYGTAVNELGDGSVCALFVRSPNSTHMGPADFESGGCAI